MRNARISILVIAAALTAMPSVHHRRAVAVQPAPGPAPFSVMTRNVYIGADLTSLLSFSSPLDLFENVAEAFDRLRETDFNLRAAKLADEIAATRPVLVGLQEVALWRSDTPADGPLSDATHVEYDFIKILRQKLRDRGQEYHLVASFTGFNFEAPGDFSTGWKDVRFTDRDMILARAGTPFEFSNPRKARYDRNFGLSLGSFGSPIYPRGWESVDVRDTTTGRQFRFINTHLEVFSASVRSEQALEIIEGPADVSMPVVIVGDFNAGQGETAYNRFINAGFRDAWRRLHSSGGATCCQDGDLENAQSELSRRIDLVFIRGALGVRKVQVVGEEQGDKTSNGLWPSDHAGVVAKLEFN